MKREHRRQSIVEYSEGGGGFEKSSRVFEITNKVRKCLICDDGVPHIFKNGTDALLRIYNGGYGT
jgi:hypothetical protein